MFSIVYQYFPPGAGDRELGTWVYKRLPFSLSHCVLPTCSLQNDSTPGKLKSERRGSTAHFAGLRDPLVGGTVRASYLLVQSRSLQNTSTSGKLKLQRCGSPANFARSRDLLFGGTARAPYLLVPCKMTQLQVSQKVKGVKLQPISPASGTLLLGTPRVRPTYTFFAS